MVADLRLDTLTGLHSPVPFNGDTNWKTLPEPLVHIPGDDSGKEQSIDVPSGDKSQEQEKSAGSLVTASATPQKPAQVALDHTKVALLLETRAIAHLPALLTHFISVLPGEWTVRFVGSDESLGMARKSVSLSNHIASGKLVLTELPEQYPINSQENISATLTDLSFYKEFLAPAEWLLVFQSDSIICSASEHSINEWVDKNHTWVGAPWHMDNRYGGNGGLSLRHVPIIIKLLETEKRVANSDWEDRWLCDRLGVMEGANMPPPSVEREFSVEGIWSDRPFGYHLRGSGLLLSGDIWGDATKRQAIFDYCPEIKIVLDMDLVSHTDATKKELSDPKKQIVENSTKL